MNFPYNIVAIAVRLYARSVQEQVTTASVIMSCVKMNNVRNVHSVQSAVRKKASGEKVRVNRLLFSQLHSLLYLFSTSWLSKPMRLWSGWNLWFNTETSLSHIILGVYGGEC